MYTEEMGQYDRQMADRLRGKAQPCQAPDCTSDAVGSGIWCDYHLAEAEQWYQDYAQRVEAETKQMKKGRKGR
jgi:hypothetical protein